MVTRSFKSKHTFLCTVQVREKMHFGILLREPQILYYFLLTLLTHFVIAFENEVWSWEEYYYYLFVFSYYLVQLLPQKQNLHCLNLTWL